MIKITARIHHHVSIDVCFRRQNTSTVTRDNMETVPPVLLFNKDCIFHIDHYTQRLLSVNYYFLVEPLTAFNDCRKKVLPAFLTAGNTLLRFNKGMLTRGTIHTAPFPIYYGWLSARCISAVSAFN